MDKSQIQKELRYRASRSSGSGGQHVNKVSSRVELLFNIDTSTGLSDSEKERIRTALANRINKDQVLVISAQNNRSQVLNRNAATARFFRLLEKTLAPRKKRKGAPKLKADPEKRIDAKKRKGAKKELRKKVIFRKDDL